VFLTGEAGIGKSAHRDRGDGEPAGQVRRRTRSVVVFHGYAPALGFWLMKLHRHQDVRILDCSRDA
jgi:hypothetical protein